MAASGVTYERLELTGPTSGRSAWVTWVAALQVGRCVALVLANESLSALA